MATALTGLDGAKAARVVGDPRVQLVGDLEDLQVLLHARLGGGQALGDAAHGEAVLAQLGVGQGAVDGGEVDADVVLDQGVDAQLRVLGLVTGPGGHNEAGHLHERGVNGGAEARCPAMTT